MPLYRRDAVERGGRDDHVEVASLTRTGMTDMFLAVVANLEQAGMQSQFERRPQSCRARARVHEALSFPSAPRNIHSSSPMENRMATGGRIHTLNVTQSASGRFSATQMLATPSTM